MIGGRPIRVRPRKSARRASANLDGGPVSSGRGSSFRNLVYLRAKLKSGPSLPFAPVLLVSGDLLEL